MKQIHVIKNYKTETGKPAEGFFKMNSQTFTLFTLLWWKKYVKLENDVTKVTPCIEGNKSVLFLFL